MRQPLSFVYQGMIAGLILALGAAAWVAREPVFAAVSGLFASGDETKGKRKRRGRKSGGSVPVVVQAVGQGRNDLAFSGIGTARALRHVTLYPAVSGEIVKVHTRAGDRIPAGAKIIELDVRQARLAVAMASSKLKGVERLHGRADRLRRKKVQSRARVLDAKSLVDQAEVELKTANVALNDHTIKAPFAGVVGIASVDVGDRVTPATQLVTLDDRSKLTVEFDVPEKYLPRLRSGTIVEVRTPGFTNRSFRGILGGIDSRVHPTRRTVVVRAEVLNHDDMLRPGMSFAIDLKLPGEAHPQIPDLALQFSQRGNYVWLIKEGTAKRVPVKIVRRQSNTVLVKGGLKPGDVIVIEGVQRLRPGRKVAVADTKSEPGKDKSPGSAATVN
ncbi:MAG: RND family efflux transporter MFP subunit [Alphaproteobacteria bacterium]|jgi:RND family efflux transporter MFP subunit